MAAIISMYGFRGLPDDYVTTNQQLQSPKPSPPEFARLWALISQFCRSDRSVLRHQLHCVEDSGCQALDLPSCSNIPTSTRSRVISARSLPAHFPPHCSSPNLIQSCPALEKLLPPYFFGYDPHPAHPIFVQIISTGPCLVH